MEKKHSAAVSKSGSTFIYFFNCNNEYIIFYLQKLEYMAKLGLILPEDARGSLHRLTRVYFLSIL